MSALDVWTLTVDEEGAGSVSTFALASEAEGLATLRECFDEWAVADDDLIQKVIDEHRAVIHLEQHTITLTPEQLAAVGVTR